MKAIVSATLVAAALIVAGAASAGEIKGVVKSMDVAKKTVTLADGQTYTFTTANAFMGLDVGHTVTITTSTGNNATDARLFTK